MALTIDELNIQIASDSSKASRALTSLIKKLEKLKDTLNGSNVSNITISNSFNKVTQSVNKNTNAVNKNNTANNKAKKSISGVIESIANGNKPMQDFTDNLARQITKWRTLYGVFQDAANTMGEWFTESNDYIETLNLFNVTMGEGAEEAREYAQSVQELVGIDMGEWMNYQGTFKQLTSGFGVASDNANVMSQNLTQLSYDLASFFNTDVETAFDKLSSAMSGQVKGLREFGIDTTVASLQEYALSKGIDTSVRSMTQAEKSMLRYNYIMEKSTLIQGDMARTLVTPANALRVLSAQLTQAKRALGNVVSVIVARFIPYVQAMVEIITEAATAIANWLGFELPTIDYSGLDTGGFADDLETAEDSTEGVSGTLKKIKKQLMGFDELNILSNPESDSGASSGGDASGSGVLDMELLEYDFLAGLKTDKLDEIKEKIYDVWDIAKKVGVAIVGWKLGSFIASLATAGTKAKGLKQSLKLIGKRLGITVGVTLAISGIALEAAGIKSAIQEELNKVNLAEIVGGGGLLIGGAALLGKQFGKTLIVSAVGGIVAGLPMFATGIYDALKNGIDWESALLIPLGGALTGAGIGAFIGGPMGALIGGLAGLAIGGITDLGIVISEHWNEMVAGVDADGEGFDWGRLGSELKASADSVIGNVLNGAMFALGAVLAFSGTNIPLGIGMMLTSGAIVAGEIALNWDSMKTSVTDTLNTMLPVLSGALLSLGAMLAFSGANVPLGIAMIALGAVSLASLVPLNWNTMPEKVKTILTDLLAIVSAPLAAIGIVLALSGTNIPLGIALIAAGVASLVSFGALNWNGVNDTVSEKLGLITAVVGGALLAIGALLAFSGVAIPLGIALIAAGAVTLATAIAPRWTEVSDKTKNIINTIAAIVGAALLVLGVILLFTGAGIPLGLGLIAAGGVSLASPIAANWDTFSNKIKDICKKIGKFFNDCWEGIKAGLKACINGLIWILNKLIDGLNLLLAPILATVNVTAVLLGYKLSEGAIKIPYIPYLADGGFVGMGQMFIAREAGPELVGQIGRKTAVANNDQIISGIESGVYRAMIAANSGKGSDITVHATIEMDGEVVGKKVIKYHNGVVMQTGESPLLV